MNYFNSTIQKKIGKCIDCPSDSPETYLTAGRCWTHYSPHRKKLMLEKQKAKSKFKSLEHTEPNQKLLIKNGKIINPDLELFYRVKMQLNEPRCAECGAYKPELKQWDKGWRSCQAHLLPKKNFRSIQTHPLISLVLGSGFSGLCLCHDIYDSSWDKASKMNIWSIVVRRFKILYPLIELEEHKFIPKQLLDTL